MGQADIWSLEMAKELTALSAQSAGADIDTLHISETIVKPRAQARVVVLDSLSELSDNAGRETAAALLDWTRAYGGIAILIVQVTKDENYAGRGWIKHWPDYVIKVSRAHKKPGHAKISLLKSRYSMLGDAIVPLGAGQIVPPRQSVRENP
jgi:predicted ATP-dependent serine protease